MQRTNLMSELLWLVFENQNLNRQLAQKLWQFFCLLSFDCFGSKPSLIAQRIILLFIADNTLFVSTISIDRPLLICGGQFKDLLLWLSSPSVSCASKSRSNAAWIAFSILLSQSSMTFVSSSLIAFMSVFVLWSGVTSAYDWFSLIGVVLMMAMMLWMQIAG